MSEIHARNVIPSRFAFMLKKVHLSRGLIIEWCKVPEFVQGLEALDDQHVEIDDVSVLNLMQKVYDAKVKTKKTEDHGAFSFRAARQAINKLSSFVNQ